MCYKIIFGLINVDCKKFFLFAPASSTRGHCYKLFVEHTSSNCRYHFFASQVIPVWNSLPSNIVNFSTLPKLKTSLFLVDLSKFLKYQLDQLYLFIRTVVSVLCEPYCPCLPICISLTVLVVICNFGCAYMMISVSFIASYRVSAYEDELHISVGFSPEWLHGRQVFVLHLCVKLNLTVLSDKVVIKPIKKDGVLCLRVYFVAVCSANESE